MLVDTPGVNDLSLQRADITYSYIPRADAVLFLLDAGQILKESERVFLQEKLLKASRDKIVFVITKWDMLSEAEQSEALAYAKNQLAKLVKDPVVFPVSAETALAGQAARASGMPELLAHLTRFLAEERGRILLDNALGEGLGVGRAPVEGHRRPPPRHPMKTDELERRIAALEKDLAGQAGTIEQRRMQIREEVSGIKAAARKDLDRFVDDVIRQLPNVIESAKPGRAEAVPAGLPGGHLQAVGRGPRPKRSRRSSRRSPRRPSHSCARTRTTARSASAALLGTDSKRLDVQVDTIRYDVGVVALHVRRHGADGREPHGRRGAGHRRAGHLRHVRPRQDPRGVQEARERARPRGHARDGEEGRLRSSTR